MKKVIEMLMKSSVFGIFFGNSTSGREKHPGSDGAARNEEKKGGKGIEKGKKAAQGGHASCDNMARNIRANISWEMLIVLSMGLSGFAYAF